MSGTVPEALWMHCACAERDKTVCLCVCFCMLRVLTVLYLYITLVSQQLTGLHLCFLAAL